MAKRDILQSAITLLRTQRWAALATTRDGCPAASMVAYALDDGGCGLLLHLSRLAAHTGNLLENPCASLVVSESDDGRADPQQLARLSISGRTAVLVSDSERYRQGRERYLSRLPTAEPLFDFPDFMLFHLEIAEARFVGGFANAHTLKADDLARAWTDHQR